MRPNLFILALVLLTAAGRKAGAQTTNSSSRLDYPSFQIISDRNIFNPNRSGRAGRSTRKEPEKAVKTESFALVGTMSYEKGSFAIFDGSSSEYRTVLKPAETIAGYKITEIAYDHVKLASTATNGVDIELAVGMQMKRQDEEEWRPGARTGSFATSSGPAAPSATSEASSGSNSSPGSTSGGGASDILKRLMEKREQELKNEKR